MLGALEAAKTRGDIRPGVDLEVIVDLLVGPLYLRLLISGVPIEQATAPEIVDVVLRGVSP